MFMARNSSKIWRLCRISRCFKSSALTNIEAVSIIRVQLFTCLLPQKEAYVNAWQHFFSFKAVFNVDTQLLSSFTTIRHYFLWPHSQTKHKSEIFHESVETRKCRSQSFWESIFFIEFDFLSSTSCKSRRFSSIRWHEQWWLLKCLCVILF